MYTGRLLCWTIRGSIPDRDKIVLLSPKRPDRLWGPPTPFSMGIEDFPGRGCRRWINRPESGADHSPQCGMSAANVLLPLQHAP